ncbi:MAG: tRNA (guanosine(37)-N1)-methyltransferase TrmD, partial [Patescibacteria group bacterium]
MNFHIITIFPEAIANYFNSSILGLAQKKKLIKINFYNPRGYAKDKHKKVDDKPFGGGPGMVLKIEPIAQAILKIKSKILNLKKNKIILLSPVGRQFTQKMARDWAKKYKNIILLSGRYEGIDERVKKIFKAEEISIGPYILTGGELPAAIIIDAVSRHIPDVLGKAESLEESRGVGFPVYTKPEVFKYNGKKYKVPKILLSGHHQKIQEWKKKHSKK